MRALKLNVGCGTAYRKGFVNIDGSHTLPRVDKIIDLSTESLLSYFRPAEADYILAADIIEHLYRWEALRLLEEFYTILSTEGKVEVQVPDAEFIINSNYSIDHKLLLLFGGQDVARNKKGSTKEMNRSRQMFPHFFCHKFGWTQNFLKKSLGDIGFTSIHCRRVNTNIVATALKQVKK